MRKAYYEASFQDFCAENESAILGELTTHHQHDLEHLQRNAWITQVKYLQAELANFPDGHIFFEFVIPRMGKRVDCLVLLNGVVFVVEFKVGSSSFDRHAIEQVVDYSLDLKNFHEGCHDATIIPVLIATNAPEQNIEVILEEDNVAGPIHIGKSG